MRTIKPTNKTAEQILIEFGREVDGIPGIFILEKRIQSPGQYVDSSLKDVLFYDDCLSPRFIQKYVRIQCCQKLIK